jgi:hypothetical protein
LRCSTAILVLAGVVAETGVLLIYLDQSWQASFAKCRDQLAGASGVVSHRPGAYASPDKIASSVRTLALRLMRKFARGRNKHGRAAHETQ